MYMTVDKGLQPTQDQAFCDQDTISLTTQDNIPRQMKVLTKNTHKIQTVISTTGVFLPVVHTSACLPDRQMDRYIDNITR